MRRSVRWLVVLAALAPCAWVVTCSDPVHDSSCAGAVCSALPFAGSAAQVHATAEAMPRRFESAGNSSSTPPAWLPVVAQRCSVLTMPLAATVGRCATPDVLAPTIAHMRQAFGDVVDVLAPACLCVGDAVPLEQQLSSAARLLLPPTAHPAHVWVAGPAALLSAATAAVKAVFPTATSAATPTSDGTVPDAADRSVADPGASAASAVAAQYLRRLQHPAQCDTARLLVFTYEESSIHGFAVMFQHLAGALLVALATNRTLVEVHPSGAEADAWPRAPPVSCHGRLFGCYFEPLSSCGFAAQYTGHLAALPLLDVHAPLAQADVPVVRMPVLGDAAPLLRRLSHPSAAPAWFPARGRLWFPAVQLYLFRPLPDVLGAPAAAAAAALAATRATVGVHVRHGDVTTLSYRDTRPADDHLRVAHAACTRWHPACFAVVASDNATVRAVASRRSRHWAATLLADAPLLQARGAADFTGNVEVALAQPAMASSPAGYSVTAGVVRDVHLLSHTAVIVGSCMSQLARLAAELAVARGVAQTPPLGFDAPECMAFQGHWFSLPLPWQPWSAPTPPRAAVMVGDDGWVFGGGGDARMAVPLTMG